MKKYLILLVAIVTVTSCDNCPEPVSQLCGGSSDVPLVDLVVIIDTSGSMLDDANTISSASDASIEEASKLCSTDLRVVFLGLDGVFNGTVFNSSHRDYLISLHGPQVNLAADRLPATFVKEQGANGVEDLSNLFDWREDACRAIFYISDEELDACCPERANGNPTELLRETAEVQLAITAALDNNVAVFSHLIDSNNLDPAIFDLYQMLSDETFGLNKASLPNEVTGAFYADLLPEVICNSCNACELKDFIK